MFSYLPVSEASFSSEEFSSPSSPDSACVFTRLLAFFEKAAGVSSPFSSAHFSFFFCFHDRARVSAVFVCISSFLPRAFVSLRFSSQRRYFLRFRRDFRQKLAEQASFFRRYFLQLSGFIFAVLPICRVFNGHLWCRLALCLLLFSSPSCFRGYRDRACSWYRAFLYHFPPVLENGTAAWAFQAVRRTE